MCSSTAENRRSVAVPGFILFRRHLFDQFVAYPEKRSNQVCCTVRIRGIYSTYVLCHSHIAPGLTVRTVCARVHLCSRSGEGHLSLTESGSSINSTLIHQELFFQGGSSDEYVRVHMCVLHAVSCVNS